MKVKFNNTCIIYGGKAIQGNKVIATDLRCGAALVIHGYVADNKRIIENSYQIDREYGNITSKLNSQGCYIMNEGTTDS